MNDLLRAIANILMWASFFALFFVFQGSPDLWDKWHEFAMAGAECKK